MNEFYYINSNNEKIGPVALTDVAKHSINSQTLVWMQGMAQWQKAAEVPAIMKHIIPDIPQTPTTPQMPPLPNNGYKNNPYNQGFNVVSNKPQNFLWLGIVTTLLCCLPAGIVSIVFATKVDNLWNQGDHQGAKKASDNAKLWGIISAGVGFVAFIFFFLIALLG